MNSSFERLFQSLKTMNIPVSYDQIEQFARYHEMLLEWNTRMDLTAVMDETEMIDRHYVDSASPLTGDWITQGARIIDVGTGAGFPGIPLAILRPDVHVTLLDAQEKRCTFLETVTKALSLSCEVIHARAEDAGRDGALRGRFDAVVSRAVALLPTLLEYTLPLTRVGGVSLCFKGPGVAQEWEQGRRAAYLLGGRLLNQVPVYIPGREEWQHLLVVCKKEKDTPRIYPRRAGTPKRAPLG